MHASQIHFVFPLTQNVVKNSLLCMIIWFTTAVSWFVDVDVLDDVGGRHRDMLEYSLTL